MSEHAWWNRLDFSKWFTGDVGITSLFAPSNGGGPDTVGMADGEPPNQTRTPQTNTREALEQAGGGGGWLRNPWPHPSTLGRVGRKEIKHGVIRYYVNAETAPSGSPDGREVLTYDYSAGGVEFNFIYNPSRVGIAWTAATDRNPLATQESPERSAIGPDGQANLDFQLMIDRTPETIQGSMPGVLGDLQVLQFLASGGGTSGTLEQVPVELALGGGDSMRMWGVIPAMSIELTHFSPEMVPMRAVVSMSMQRYQSLVQGGGAVSPGAQSRDDIEEEQAILDAIAEENEDSGFVYGDRISGWDGEFIGGPDGRGSANDQAGGGGGRPSVVW